MTNHPHDVILDPTQQKVLELIPTGRNIYVPGPAGSGKSVLAEAIKNLLGDKIILLSPIGVGALNISGSTVHSFFHFPLGLLTPASTSSPRHDSYLKKLMLNVSTILIDEIGLLRSDAFAMINFKLRQLSDGQDKDQPFAEKQLIRVGDFNIIHFF